MKKFITFFLLALIILTFLVPAFALDTSESFYVADYANIFSKDIEDGIVDINGQLEHYCDNAQIVVVTIDYFGDRYADEYAVQLFNDWNVSKNGMLLVVSPIEKRGGLTCGYEISNKFSSSKMESCMNKYFWDYFDSGKYDKAITSLMSALVEWYEDEYNVTLNYANSVKSSFSGAALLILIVLLLIVFVIIIEAISASKQKWRAYHDHLGVPIPPYHFWYLFTGPHIHWHYPRDFIRPRGPRGPGGYGGGFNSNSFSGSNSSHFGGGFSGRGFGGGGHSGGGFGGRR